MIEKEKILHPRNLHKGDYDFPVLSKSCPELSSFLQKGKNGQQTIDFSQPEAVKALNKALLLHFYGITNWDVPPGYLIPSVPGRADYVHYAADLLADPETHEIPKGKSVKVLDIGVGANCVYPIIGNRQYGWSFAGIDIDPVAIKAAKAIVDANPVLKGKINIRLQKHPDHIFKGIIKEGEFFDLCLCNPPFFDSEKTALEAARQKWKKLGRQKRGGVRNFGGQKTELVTEGGEVAFIKKMIMESTELAGQIRWFTTLVSNRDSLPATRRALKKVKPVFMKEMASARGQKLTRILCWTFLS